MVHLSKVLQDPPRKKTKIIPLPEKSQWKDRVYLQGSVGVKYFLWILGMGLAKLLEKGASSKEKNKNNSVAGKKPMEGQGLPPGICRSKIFLWILGMGLAKLLEKDASPGDTGRKSPRPFQGQRLFYAARGRANRPSCVPPPHRICAYPRGCVTV
jgi:hypothetical protein